jgi:hypothetical protein
MPNKLMTFFILKIKPATLKRLLTYSLIIALFSTFVNLTYAETFGILTGRVVDKQTGEPLIGASVLVGNTGRGASSDLDGSYFIDKIPPGAYSVVFQLLGYAKTKVDSVNIPVIEIARLNMSLQTEDYRGHDIVVTARATQNTESSLLKQRQKSNTISDAISSEAISRAGSSDAADAMTQVTGASVVGGKYVYIRGLGDRYSNTQLNGAELPSADPDKRAFQMDLLPANLLENIVTVKSYTPDQPGNFSGGLMNISTKTYPEKFTLRLSLSSAWLSGTTNNNDFLSSNTGGKDWIGMDNGAREIPDVLKNPSVHIPDVAVAYRDSSSAHALDSFSKAFNNQMAPVKKTAPTNKNLSISVGNKSYLFGKPLGYLTSFSYGHNYQFYENGKVERWQLGGSVQTTDSLTSFYKLKDTRSTDEVLWGSLSSVTFMPSDKHSVSIIYMYTQSGENENRYLIGDLPEALADATYETRVLHYTERNLQSFQLKGSHRVKLIAPIETEWLASYTYNRQNEPDLRYFSDHFYVENYGTSAETSYSIISYGGYKLPERIYRHLYEDNLTFDFKASMPFEQWSGLTSKFKFGISSGNKYRAYGERTFQYANSSSHTYNGNPEDYFNDPYYVGIIDSTGGRYTFANYITEVSGLRSNYTGRQNTRAAFGMLELPITTKLRAVGGGRIEGAKIDVATRDTTANKGRLHNADWLSSFALIYQTSINSNLRFSYGRTLARPNFRELAPYPSYEFSADYYFLGNANLKRTLIDNFDLRYDWFIRPGEILAASLFYKHLKNPIERATVSQNAEIQFQNVNVGTVRGLELEARLGLDRFSRRLTGFQIGGNLTFIKSRVTISEEEMVSIRAADSLASNHRPLWGQSSYIINCGLGYENRKSGSTADLSFNLNGKRLTDVSLGATPEIYEVPQAKLDISLSQKLISGVSIKLALKNLLDSPYKRIYTYKGVEYIYRQNKFGRSISFGLTYSL